MVQCNHVEEAPISCAFHNGTGRLDLHLSQRKLCCATPLIQLHPTTIIPATVLPHNLMCKPDLKSGFYYITINLQTHKSCSILFGQCCQCLTRHSMGHYLAASIIHNLPDCSVSSLSAFQCHYCSLPSLLADLWTHSPSEWHFVVPSSAFTVIHSCIGLGVPWVSHGFQARLNETHF